MLKLIAYAPEDGWAFINDNETVYLIRPPYSAANKERVSASLIGKAVSEYGFQPNDHEFPDWPSLILFLKDEIEKSHSERTKTIPGEAFFKLLKHAPRHIVEQYLKRVENELIPTCNWEAATRILAAILNLEMAGDDKELREYATRLVRISGEAAKAKSSKHELLINSDLELTSRFPRAIDKYGAERMRKFMSRVAQQGQLLTVGA